jgi:hypothetical protein
MPKHPTDLLSTLPDDEKAIQNCIQSLQVAKRTERPCIPKEIVEAVGELDISDTSFAKFLIGLGVHMGARKRSTVSRLAKQIFRDL